MIGALALVKGARTPKATISPSKCGCSTCRGASNSPDDDSGQRRRVRRMAKRFADEISRSFTGERGPFDSQIAFLSTRGGRFKDLYVMSPNGDDVRRITDDNTLNLSPQLGSGRTAQSC